MGGGGGSRGQGVVTRAAPDPAFRPVANPGYDAWVEGFRARAAAKGDDERRLPFLGPR